MSVQTQCQERDPLKKKKNHMLLQLKSLFQKTVGEKKDVVHLLARICKTPKLTTGKQAAQLQKHLKKRFEQSLHQVSAWAVLHTTCREGRVSSNEETPRSTRLGSAEIQQRLPVRKRSEGDSPSWLVGVQTNTAILEDSSAVPYRAKYDFTR